MTTPDVATTLATHIATSAVQTLIAGEPLPRFDSPAHEACRFAVMKLSELNDDDAFAQVGKIVVARLTQALVAGLQADRALISAAMRAANDGEQRDDS